MNFEKEVELQNEQVKSLLNKLEILQSISRREGEYELANTLGAVHCWLQTLNRESVELVRENTALHDQQRSHYAGLAMQGIISRCVKADILDVDKLTESAFSIADTMVMYGKKQEGKTKGTEDGLGNTSSENSNPEQS